MLDAQLIEALLHTAEGNAHDYKQTQYPLDDDVRKSELIKDIVTFANAWKASDAHILVGVEDGKGKRGIVHGVATHHDDATLQQLVNSKLNRPITFEYVPTTVDGRDIAIIRIAKDQQRPFFLKKKFGALEAGRVYVRQGSSTAIADPDEVARMGEARNPPPPAPRLSLAIGDRKTRAPISPIVVRSRVLVDPPPDTVFGARVLIAERLVGADFTKPSPEHLQKYRRAMALITPLAFAVTNTGDVLLEDVIVRVTVPKKRGLLLQNWEPTKPTRPFEAPGIPEMYGAHTLVADRGEYAELVAHVGKVQPAATVWSDPFWIGSTVKGELQLVARVFADNLAKPVDVPMPVRFIVTQRYDYGENAPEIDPDDEDDDDATGT